jgi:hypothetical protein
MDGFRVAEGGGKIDVRDGVVGEGLDLHAEEPLLPGGADFFAGLGEGPEWIKVDIVAVDWVADLIGKAFPVEEMADFMGSVDSEFEEDVDLLGGREGRPSGGPDYVHGVFELDEIADVCGTGAEPVV